MPNGTRSSKNGEQLWDELQERIATALPLRLAEKLKENPVERTHVDNLEIVLHTASTPDELLRIGNLLVTEGKRLDVENSRLYRQVNALHKLANQQLNMIRKLTWTPEQWAQYEKDHGPQDCGPSEPYRVKG